MTKQVREPAARIHAGQQTDDAIVSAMLSGGERFAAYVAHEPRTPLATQRALLEPALADRNAMSPPGELSVKTSSVLAMQQERLLDACLTFPGARVGREPVDSPRLQPKLCELTAKSGLERTEDMMNDNIHFTPRPVHGEGRAAGWRGREWPSARRTVGAVIVAAGLALLASACGGSPSSHVAQLSSTATATSTSSSTPSAASTQQNGTLAFTNCMRSHGVPNFPDPDSSGNLVKQPPQQLGVSSSELDTAQAACQHLLPTPTQSPAQRQHERTADLLRLAQCMRAHGIHDFPDPTSTGQITKPPGVDTNSPQVQAAAKACQQYVPPHAGSGRSRP